MSLHFRKLLEGADLDLRKCSRDGASSPTWPLDRPNIGYIAATSTAGFGCPSQERSEKFVMAICETAAAATEPALPMLRRSRN